jgi:hypothetical protein
VKATIVMTATMKTKEGQRMRTVEDRFRTFREMFSGAIVPALSGIRFRTLSWTLTLGAFLVLGASPAGAVSAVSLPSSATVAPGGDVVVPIVVSPADSVLGMDFTIGYDPAILTPTGVFTTSFTDGFNAFFYISSPGQLRISLFSTDAAGGVRRGRLGRLPLSSQNVMTSHAAQHI